MDTNNYNIYVIKNNKCDKVYIGSTKWELDKRLSWHGYTYNCFIKSGKKYISSIELLKHGECTIELLEHCENISKEELSKKEGEYIRHFDCVNIRVEGRTQQEYNNEHKNEIKLWNKQYRQKNKDKIKEQRRNYREANKDKIKEQKKIYREANKDKIKEQKASYYQANKDKIKEQKASYYQANKDKIKKAKTNIRRSK